MEKKKLDGESLEDIETLTFFNPNIVIDHYLYYPAHKNEWVRIILDDSILDKDVMGYIHTSYTHIQKQKGKKWLIPANPKYYDIDEGLQYSTIMRWKQSSDVKVNDIVYVYVGSPISCIMYKFKAIEVNLPYYYEDENLSMKKTMNLKLLERYEQGEFPFSLMKEFGVNAVRGPRYMPESLHEYINGQE